MPTNKKLALPDEITTALSTVMRAFDEGVFVRNISRDNEPGWGIRQLPFIMALGVLVRYLEHGDADKREDANGR